MNFVRNRLRSRGGFSLVELLIALTLLGGVLGVAYSLHYYGLVSFSRGENQLAKQQDVRFVAKILSDEIRFAPEIEIINGSHGSFTPESNGDYFLFNDEGKIIKRTKQNGSIKDQIIADGRGEYELWFEMNYKERENGEEEVYDLLVDVTVSSGSGSQKYEITTTVLALNITSTNKENNETGSILCIRSSQ